MSDILRKAAQAALDAYDEDEFIDYSDTCHFRIMEALRTALAETTSIDALIAEIDEWMNEAPFGEDALCSILDKYRAKDKP